MKRLGGCFCWKLNRTAIISAVTALAAQKVDCQVKMILLQDVDTDIIYGDHNVLVKYKISFDSSTGKILALEIDYFVDSGYSYQTNVFIKYSFSYFLCFQNQLY